MWSIALDLLREEYGPAWAERVGLVAKRREGDPRLEGISEVERLKAHLTLGQKLRVIKRIEPLASELYRLEGRGGKDWFRVEEIRNRIAHADRRAQSPIAPEEVDALRALASDLGRYWRQRLVQQSRDEAT